MAGTRLGQPQRRLIAVVGDGKANPCRTGQWHLHAEQLGRVRDGGSTEIVNHPSWGSSGASSTDLGLSTSSWPSAKSPNRLSYSTTGSATAESPAASCASLPTPSRTRARCWRTSRPGTGRAGGRPPARAGFQLSASSRGYNRGQNIPPTTPEQRRNTETECHDGSRSARTTTS